MNFNLVINNQVKKARNQELNTIKTPDMFKFQALININLIKKLFYKKNIKPKLKLEPS